MEYSETITEALKTAQEIVEQYRHEFITPEHLLAGILDRPGFQKAANKCFNIEVVAKELIGVVRNMESMPEGMDLSYEYSEQFKEMCQHAAQAAMGSGAHEFEISHFLYGIFQLEDSYAKDILTRNLEVSIPDFLNTISAAGVGGELGVEGIMDRYFMPYPGVCDIVGREKEMDEAIRILGRKRKNNVLIVGGNGVGKSALVMGLSERFNAMDVSRTLSGKYISELLTSRILSGTQYRGDLENRVEEIMEAVKLEGHTIVYIDDFKSLGNFGKMDDGSRDILKLLVPYLKSPEIRFIVSATPEDLKTLQGGDTGVFSLFRKIELEEPSDEEAKAIIEKAIPFMADYHDVRYDKDIAGYAVRMSRRYIQDRCLPDKAVDLIDEAGSYAVSKNLKKVTTKVIDKVLADICGSDIQASDGDVRKDLYNLEANLRKHIYGQDGAIKTLTEAILMSKAGLLDSGKTIGNFLFVGPTGVGKTELSKVLAQQLHVPLHRFDMSEYSEKHSVAKLIGSPAGYVGYDDGGILTDTVRRNPYCVLLLDEIEKAHEDIYNLLLQIMDYAVISDNKGRKVDFRNAVIIMTSNAGARYAHSASVGYEKKVNAGAAMAKEVKKVFAPEFINRLSSVVVFNDMDRNMASLILKERIRRLQERLKDQNVKLDVKKEAFEKLLDEGFSPEYGAREIERVLNARLTPLLMREILFGAHKEGFTATITPSEDGYTLSV